VTIAQLATDTRLKAFARKYAGEYADDLIQDAILVLLQLEKGRVEQIHEQGSLRAYAQQIIYNIRHGKGKSETITDIEHITGAEFDHIQDEQPIDPDPRTDILNKSLKRLYWYDRDLFLLYSDMGSCRKVANVTGINYLSIHRTIKKVRNELRADIMGSM
jgi:RNA polymerase sigma factor (sigma-70 family)